MNVGTNRTGVSRYIAILLLVLGIAIGWGGEYLIMQKGQNQSGNQTSSTKSSSTASSLTSPVITVTFPSVEESSLQALSPNDKLLIGWNLDNHAATNYFDMVVRNLGHNSLARLSFILNGVLSPTIDSEPLPPNSTRLYDYVFVGGIICRYSDCLVGGSDQGTSERIPVHADLRVNATFSNSGSYSIPLTPDVAFPDTFLNPEARSDNSSAFCQSLLEGVSVSNSSLRNSVLSATLKNTGIDKIGVASWVIRDPLNPSGIFLQRDAVMVTNIGGINVFLNVVSPKSTQTFTQDWTQEQFVIGKQYSVWLQLGVAQTSSNVYSGYTIVSQIPTVGDSFCTLGFSVVSSG